MTNGVINAIGSLVKKAIPSAVFECDREDMMNIKVDGIRRGVPFVWVEEPEEARLMAGANPAYIRHEIRMYFCAWEDFQNTGYRGESAFSAESPKPTRLEIIERIEGEMVVPFLNELVRLDWVKRLKALEGGLRLTYPPSMFDGNEVSVCLDFEWCEILCPLPYCLVVFDLSEWIEADAGELRVTAGGVELQVKGKCAYVRTGVGESVVWSVESVEKPEEFEVSEGVVKGSEVKGVKAVVCVPCVVVNKYCEVVFDLTGENWQAMCLSENETRERLVVDGADICPDDEGFAVKIVEKGAEVVWQHLYYTHGDWTVGVEGVVTAEETQEDRVVVVVEDIN